MITPLHIYFALAAFILSFAGGMFTEHKFSVASQVGALYDEIATTKKEQEGTEALVGVGTAKITDLNGRIEPLRETLYAETAKNPSKCIVLASTLRVLADTAKVANNSTGGIDQ